MTLRVRRARASDAAAMAAIYAPFVLGAAVSFETEAPDAAEMEARIAQTGKDYPWLVADEGGRMAGYVYAAAHSGRAAYQWSANVSIYLHPDYRRRGLGAQLYGVLFALLKRQGFRSLYAGVTLPNAASIALHRKMGMGDVGIYRNVGFKHGAWHDVLWLGLSFPDDGAPAGPPLSFEGVPDSAVDTTLSIR